MHASTWAFLDAESNRLLWVQTDDSTRSPSGQAVLIRGCSFAWC
jgi:hypothetical protein